MASLFISYSRKDKETAHQLAETLEGQELDCWIDSKGIEPTTDWWKEIEKGIEEADNFIFLISPDSAVSKVCRRELDHAVKNGKRLIPVVVRDAQTEEVAAELRSLNWIFLRAADDFNTGLGKLIKGIKTDYAWAQAHKQLLVKALEWERSARERSFLLRGKELQESESQVVTNAAKEPHPTDLQRDYLLKSREVSNRQKQATAVGAIVIAIILAGLAVFGWIQAGLASQRATISRARELAAQSVALRDRDFQTALLLGVEAFRTLDTVQTRGLLLDNAQAKPQLKRFLDGNTSRIARFAFSPDGRILAAAGEDETVILWDVDTGERIGQPMRSEMVGVNNLAFSPDNTLLAASNGDTIIVWDIATGHPIGEPYILYGSAVYDILYSSKRELLAFGMKQGNLILWDASTLFNPNVKLETAIGQPLNVSAYSIDEFAFSPNGKTVALSVDENTIILGDLETGQIIGQPLRGHTDFIASLAFSPDGKLLASGGWDDSVILWDVETGQALGPPLRANLGSIYGLAFHPQNGETLVAATGQAILLWNVKTGQPIGQPLSGHSASVHTIAFSPDGKTFVSGGEDGSILLWDVSTMLDTSTETEQPIGQPLRGHNTTIRSLAFHPDEAVLASGSGDGTILLWDAATSQLLRELPGTEQTSSLHSIAFRPGPQANMLAASSGSEIFLWDVSTLLDTSTEPRQLTAQPLRGHYDFIHSLAFSPDGTMLASAGEDKSVILWDVETQQPIGAPMRGHGAAIWSVAFSPDGRMLASGSEDQSVILWNVETQQPIGPPLKGHSFAVMSVAFSPDGKLLASGSSDESIVLWDVATGKRVGPPLREHTSDVLTLVFSPDGKFLVSGSNDNAIILWDVQTGQPIGQPLRGHSDSVWSIAFSPDGKRLASGGSDTTLFLWDVDPQSWIQKTCQRVRRNFIQAQWAQYFQNEEYRKSCEEFPRHPSFYRELAEGILDSDEPTRVQKALAEVKREMEMDSPITDPAAESWKTVEQVMVSVTVEEVNNHRWEEALSLMGQAEANHLPLDSLLMDTEIVYSLCWEGSLEGYAVQVLEYCDRVADSIPDEYKSNSDIPYLRDLARILAAEPSLANDLYPLMDICWDGSLAGYAARVLDYCERAVELATDDPDVRDYRGLARALTGDFGGAVEDFQFYIDQGGNPSLIPERQEWIVDLKAGRNPFTPELIERLRNE